MDEHLHSIYRMLILLLWPFCIILPVSLRLSALQKPLVNDSWLLHPPAVTDQPRAMLQSWISPTTTSQGFISRFCLHQPHNQSSILHPNKVSVLKWWPQMKNSSICRKKSGCLLRDTKAIGSHTKPLAIISEVLDISNLHFRIAGFFVFKG